MASASASGNATEDKNRERRNRVVLGNLPADFLRPEVSASGDPGRSQQELSDHQLALQLQQQQWIGGRHASYAQNYVGQLIITVVEATLVKNYGMTRMDPYVRLRVGHTVYETHADPSAGRTPRWNKRIQSYLPAGVKTINLQIYDECALTMDELVAHGQIQLPEALFQHQVVDDWFPLSGKQGENKEGSIHLILSLMPMSCSMMGFTMAPTYAGYPVPGATVMPVGPSMSAPVMMVPPYGIPAYSPVSVYNSPVPVAATVSTNPISQQPKPLSEEEMKDIESMFPSLDRQVIQSVVDACGGRREAIIDSLLQLSDQ